MAQNLNNPTKKDQVITTARARFDMFVVLKPGTVTWFPGQKTTWCYRGDRFTSEENRMLPSLLQILIKKIDSFRLIEIYDNKFPFQDPRRLVAKISDGVVEKNELKFYNWMLNKVILPDYLKQ